MHRPGNQFFDMFTADALQGYPTDSGFECNLLVPYRIQDLADLPTLAPERFGHRAETVDEVSLQATGDL